MLVAWLTLGALALGVLSEPQRPAEPVGGPFDYFWTVSASADGSRDNGVQPWTGARDLYLWLDCSYFNGVTRLEMDLESAGIALLSFTSMNGFTQSGVFPNLTLTHGECPVGPVVVGVVGVEDAAGAGGWICAGPTRALEDCDPVPGLHGFGFYGFFTEGNSLPCAEFCPVDFVIPFGWGKVKAQYRAGS